MSPSDAPKPLVAESSFDAIDMHVHLESPRLPGLKSVPDDVVKLYASDVSKIAERVKSEMAEAKLSHVFGMGSLGGAATDPLGIARTLEIAKLVPGVHAIGAIDLRMCDSLKTVEAQIDNNREKIVALKAYLGYLHFGPEDPSYTPYYKLAAKYKIPVIFHTGDNWSTTAHVKYAHPLRIDEVATDHPEVNFVMAHFGNPWLVDAAEVLFKNPNVWADLSGLIVGNPAEIRHAIVDLNHPESYPAGLGPDLKKAFAYVGDYTKFLYGSDWPLAPMADYRRFVEAIVPGKHHAAVFRDNASRLFLPLPK